MGQAARQWYTRRDGVIRGPYAAGEISRHLLLGRIRTEDELTDNGRDWRPALTVSELVPTVLLQGDVEALAEARAAVDERGRSGEVYRGPERRRAGVQRPHFARRCCQGAALLIGVLLITGWALARESHPAGVTLHQPSP
jgi:hypothetical protein